MTNKFNLRDRVCVTYYGDMEIGSGTVINYYFDSCDYLIKLDIPYNGELFVEAIESELKKL
jgi:hypothetical protein